MKSAGILLNSNAKITGFTIVENKLLSASNLSLKAKGLYAYLASKPDRWNFSSTRMANELKEGVDGIKNTLIELEELNLLRRRKIKDDNGNWNGVVYFLISPSDSNIITEYHNNKKDDGSRGKSLEERKQIFRDRCAEIYKEKQDRFPSAEAKKFFDYWTETTYGGQKMRFEMQTAFDIGRRMETWIRNNRNFNVNSSMKSTTQLKKGLITNNT